MQVDTQAPSSWAYLAGGWTEFEIKIADKVKHRVCQVVIRIMGIKKKQDRLTKTPVRVGRFYFSQADMYLAVYIFFITL